MVTHKLKVDGTDLVHANIYLDDKPIQVRELTIDMGGGQYSFSHNRDGNT